LRIATLGENRNVSAALSVVVLSAGSGAISPAWADGGNGSSSVTSAGGVGGVDGTLASATGAVVQTRDPGAVAETPSAGQIHKQSAAFPFGLRFGVAASAVFLWSSSNDYLSSTLYLFSGEPRS
jgi:hypothetical protein